MAGYTKNFNLKLPSDIEFYDIEDFNENFEKIDQMAVKKGEGIGELTGGALSDRPEPGIAGRYYFAQDTGEIFLDTGEEWVLAAASQKEFDEHLAEKATQDGYGHIRLKDIPNPEVATKAEAEAGTNNTKMMTPLRTNQAIDSRFRWVDGLLEVYMDGEWKRFEEKPPIYGVEIDESNSNPETSVTYTDDAIGFIPASGGNGNFSWGSWESIIKEEFQIRPCVLRNLGGGNAEVNYYLDYDDYTKKADGSNARLDGTDGDVMIEFGVPLWWKFSRVGSKLKIQLSNKEFDGAVKYAFEIEDGYNQVPIYPLFLTQIIYLLMFKHLDSQTALGRGYVDGNTDFLNTGTSNNRPFMFGETTGKQQIKFLGMEDYWGNRRWWIDGCFYDDNRNILIGKGNFNDEGNGYTNYGQATPSDGGGYIDKIQGQNETGFIPASISGSATTFYCDYGTVYAGRLPYFGGTRSDGVGAGAFYLYSNPATYSSAHVGGRLFYSKDSKIYIGAYLGVNQGGKLRSISGYESHNNATIGEFRNLARANNN